MGHSARSTDRRGGEGQPVRRRRAAALLAGVALLGGCALQSSGSSGSVSDRTVVESRRFNGADVTFATEMVQHHAQALIMVDAAYGKRLRPEVAALADDIRMAQGPEIEQMVGLLRDWGKPVPATGRDHVGHHDAAGGHHAAGMPGMASARELTALDRAEGRGFERRFLTLMIDHHRGAITMAESQLDDGKNREAREIASRIATGQRREIDRMEQLLAELP